MSGQIKDEHSGSSIAIVTAISALRNKLNNLWQRLKSKLNDLSIPTEAELFLLICSIFPDDSKIPIEDLVIHGMGLSLFKGVHNITEARFRVYDLIKIINDLKYSPKVIGSKTRLAHEKDRTHFHYVRMLVGARDLAKSIASSNPLVFHRETIIEKWPESNWYKNCYALSLVLKKVKEHHVNLKCPKLTLLQLQYKEDSQRIPIDFFEGMKELCVLSLDVPSVPQSLNVLRNLISLRLKVLKFEDVSSIGSLINLEFLSISVLSPTDIPMEVGQLEKLRLLDIREMNIQYFPPGILSRLSKLEELYLPLSFSGWGCKVKKYDDYDECELGEEDNYADEERISAIISEIDEERINANLAEITSLSLNALQISVPKASKLPKKSLIFKHIQWFKILMSNAVRYQPFKEDSINELQLTGEACDIIESGVCDLMGRTKDLSFIRVRNLKNVIYQLEDNGFPELKKMIIAECDELEYVVDTMKKQSLPQGVCLFEKLECLHLSMLSNLKEIGNGRLTNSQWLPNLSEISIRFCHKLKYVFPLSIVKGSKLKSIEVLDCNEMEGIFNEDNEEGIPLKLGTVENLELHSLPKMISLLLNGVPKDTNQSLTTYKMVSNASRLNEGCVDNEGFICLPPYSPSCEKPQKIVIEQLDSYKHVSPIKKEDIVSHMVIECAFPAKLAEKWLQNLKRLKIAFCDAVKVIFLFEENHATSKAFNSLKELELHGLPNLVHIWFHIPPKISPFQNLQLLVLSECNNSYLFSCLVAKLLVKLEKVCVSRCEKMEEIIVKEDEKEAKAKIVFPRLQFLELQRIPNLRTFSPGIYEIELPLLKSLKFNQCNKIQYFSKRVPRTPMLERIEINGSLCSLTSDLNATINRFYGRFYADLEIATSIWSPDNLLGKGDFGEAYKGWIDEKTFSPSKPGTGMMVAIKKLNPEIGLGFEEWQLAVEFLEKLSHPNLVKLLGHGWVDKELLLVCEFMQRGSLDNHLFTSNPASEPLSWDMRIKIAIGAARGLDFLHSNKVFHVNIKPSNVLVDDNYNAKISDYGLAVSWWLSDYYPKSIKSSGCAAPEFFSGAKSDVYSFGMVLLVLITGLRALDKNGPTALVEMVHRNANRIQLNEFLDVRIKGQSSPKAMLLAEELVFNCVKYDAKDRPSMEEVVAALEQIDAINKNPEGSKTS